MTKYVKAVRMLAEKSEKILVLLDDELDVEYGFGLRWQ